MSQVSLKLVHNRPFAGAADDLAVTLLFSFGGLTLNLAFMVLATAKTFA